MSASKIQKSEGLRYLLRGFLKQLQAREREHGAFEARMEHHPEEDGPRNYAHGWANGAAAALRAVEEALGVNILSPKERLTTPMEHIDAAIRHIQSARGLDVSSESEGLRLYLMAVERDLGNYPRMLDPKRLVEVEATEKRPDLDHAPDCEHRVNPGNCTCNKDNACAKTSPAQDGE